MKTLSFLTLLLIPFISFSQAQWGVSAAFLFEADEAGYLEPGENYTTLGSATLVRGEVGFPWGNWLIGGAYMNFSPSREIYRMEYSPTIFELGFFLGPQIDVGSQHQASAVAQIGYRGWFGALDPFNSLGTNLNLNFIFNKDNKVSPKVDVGFLAQPSGGNDDIFFSHSPTWYIGGGVIFR